MGLKAIRRIHCLWAFGVLILLILASIFVFDLWTSFSRGKSAYKLIFVDETCKYRFDSTTSELPTYGNFWNKLLLVNHLSGIAKDVNRKMLILSCPTIGLTSDYLPWCEIITSNENIICKKLSPSQASKHIGQCISNLQESDSISRINFYENKRRVYFCEDQYMSYTSTDVISLTDNIFLDLNFSSFVKGEKESIVDQIMEDNKLLVKYPIDDLDFASKIFFTSGGPQQCPEEILCILVKYSILKQNFHFDIFFGPQTKLNITTVDTLMSTNYGIFRILLDAKWLFVGSIDNSVTEKILLMIEMARFRHRKTACSSYLRRTSSSWKGETFNFSAPQYFSWCRSLFEAYTTTHGDFTSSLSLTSKESTSSQEKTKLSPKLNPNNYPFLSTSDSLSVGFGNTQERISHSWWNSQYRLFYLRFWTRSFFRAQVLGWGGLFLLSLLLMCRYSTAILSK